MAKITANYEVVYVLDPAQGEEAIAAQVANFKSLAEQNGSDVVVEEWGNRKLAYPINLQDRGLLCAHDLRQRPGSPASWIVSCGSPRASCVPLIVCKGE